MFCNDCSIEFSYFPGEIEAYNCFQSPAPLNCPDCRRKRRMSFRNEKKLYHNKSYKSDKQIITLYPPDTAFKIIDNTEWLEDGFDAAEYGRDFDFYKPFFEQFKGLQLDVPRWARISLNCENSDFTNNCANIKNSYLTFSSHDSENLYYCVRVNRSHDCIDCMSIAACEYCSNCVDCEKCYNVHYSQLIDNSSDCWFLFDCRQCHNCILCAGIKNGEYMVLNKQYSKYEYEKYKEEFFKKIEKDLEGIKALLQILKEKIIHRNLHIINSENCFGDFIVNSKNILNGFKITNSEDCINVHQCDRLKSSCDCFCNDKSELCLECDTNYDCYNSKFSTYFVESKNVQYVDQCFWIQNCFGCVGLKRQSHMILNKKYSEVDYKIMLNKIRDHMKRTGEYGKAFPATLSAFAYNETVAYDAYPLNEQEAVSQGYFWHKEEGEAKYFGKKYEIPKNIGDVDDSICNSILRCEKTGKNYKIIPQELKFYKKFHLPLPKICPDQRYRELLSLRNPEKLRNIKCNSCNKETKTTYPSTSNYKILCEECYLKTVY